MCANRLYLLFFLALLLNSCFSDKSHKITDVNLTTLQVAKKPLTPDFYIGNFFRSDTLLKKLPADSDAYAVIQNILGDNIKNSAWQKNKFNCDLKVEIIDWVWLITLLKEKKISLPDTTGMTRQDTNIYSIDWTRLKFNNCIGLNEIFRNGQTYKNLIGNEKRAVYKHKAFVKAFGCEALRFISYPNFNKDYTVAHVVVNLWLQGSEYVSWFCLMRKVNGQWESILCETIFIT